MGGLCREAGAEAGQVGPVLLVLRLSQGRKHRRGRLGSILLPHRGHRAVPSQVLSCFHTGLVGGARTAHPDIARHCQKEIPASLLACEMPLTVALRRDSGQSGAFLSVAPGTPVPDPPPDQMLNPNSSPHRPSCGPSRAVSAPRMWPSYSRTPSDLESRRGRGPGCWLCFPALSNYLISFLTQG